MRALAGPGASVAFTNLSSATSASLSSAFTTDTNANPPTGTTSDSASPVAAAQVECHEQGVLALMQSRNIPHERVCLLDPKASLALSPSDGDTGKFTWFLFGVRASLSPSHILIPFLSLAGLIGYPRYVLRGTAYTCERANRNPEGGAACDASCVSMVVMTMMNRRRPSTRPYRRTSRARFPNASFGSRPDDNRHGARRDEARRRRSWFVFLLSSSCSHTQSATTGSLNY